MSFRVDSPAAIEPVSSSTGTNPFKNVFDAARQQENRLRNTVSEQMMDNPARREFSEFLDTTFKRLSPHFTDPLQAQTFRTMKQEMIATQANNESFIRSKIQSGIRDIQLELSLKATNKVSQGLQQLLSAQ